MRKKIISFFIAFILCFTSLLPFTLVSFVFAADTSWLTPTDSYVKGTSVTNAIFNTTLISLQSLFDRNNINYNNYYIVVSDSSVSTGKHVLMFPKGNENLANYNFESSFDGSTYNVYTGDNIYVIADDFSSLSLFANSYQSNKYGLCMDNIGYYGCQFSNKIVNNVFTSPYFIYFSSLNVALLPEDAPDYDSHNVLYGMDLGINELDFYQWLVDNDKVNVSVGSDGGITVSGKIPSYIGLQKLSSFIHFYNQFGSNRSNFLANIKDWFSYMNIVNQTSDNCNILKSTMDSLYQEYINSFWREVHPYFGNIPHHRRNIETNTTDDDTTLITDVSGDSTDTSILRDILRGIISINNSVCDGTVSLKNAIDGLDFTVNVANGGGMGLTAVEIWGSGDITQSSNYQALADAFVEHGVMISDVESLQYNYLAGQTQKDSFTVSVDMPDEYINGEFTKKTITHTVDSNSKMYDTLVLFRKIIALAVILFYVVRLKLALPSLIKGE